MDHIIYGFIDVKSINRMYRLINYRQCQSIVHIKVYSLLLGIYFIDL